MNNFIKLIKIVKKLRAPDGCEWDKDQTHETLIPYLLEEAYEVIEAIENNDYNALKEELGDLLLHVIFQAEISNDKGQFSIEESLDCINTKLINRHPLIFKKQESKEIIEKESWEILKQKEKKRESILDGVPKSLPALLKARRVQEKAASVGFDWDRKEQVFKKIEEEVLELKESLKTNEGIEEELGDVLFSIVNFSRHLNINPEQSLRESIKKFTYRFKKIEKNLKIKNIKMQDLSLKELDHIWEENKKNNK